MKKERKKDIDEMAEAIDDVDKFASKYMKISKESISNTIPAEIVRNRNLKSTAEILATKKLEIPKCFLAPVNGRIYAIEVSGSDLKSPGGLVLPTLFGPKKDDSMQDVKRYFAVAWDTAEIPLNIQNKLSIGTEVNPMIMKEAIEFNFPEVIDWQGNNIFKVIHYTELAGISSVKPERVK